MSVMFVGVGGGSVGGSPSMAGGGEVEVDACWRSVIDRRSSIGEEREEFRESRDGYLVN